MLDLKRIRAARSYHGLTQQDLAAKLNRSQAWVSYLESGQLLPSTEILRELHRILGDVEIRVSHG